MVQPASCQETLLQETRETDELGRGTSVQGRTPGERNLLLFPIFHLFLVLVFTWEIDEFH